MKTMKALVWREDGSLALTDRPVPRLFAPEDAVVKVTLSTICTSDLHIVHGAVPRRSLESCWAMNLWELWRLPGRRRAD